MTQIGRQDPQKRLREMFQSLASRSQLPKRLALYDTADLVPDHHTAAAAGAIEVDSPSPAVPVYDVSSKALGMPDRTLLILRQRYNDAVQALSSESLN